jgi:thioredoxin-related protein
MMNCLLRFTAIAGVMLAVLPRCATAQVSADAGPAGQFVPLNLWKSAVLAADRAALKFLYSTSPALQVASEKESGDGAAETEFWIGLKARTVDLDIIEKSSPRPDLQVIVFQAAVQSGGQTRYVNEAQAWQQQGDDWRLVIVKHTPPAYLKQPATVSKNIYPDNADAHKEIKEAEERAAEKHKRVLLVFGANWCYDCHVLDLAFHRSDFTSAMAGFEVVHVDIGEEGKKNTDLAKQFQVPREKGIPALAVIESDGKLVVSQKNSEFENARAMTPQKLLEFLNKWKPEAR